MAGIAEEAVHPVHLIRPIHSFAPTACSFLNARNCNKLIFKRLC